MRHLCLAGLVATTLVACDLRGLPGDDEVGMGLPQQLPGETYPGARHELTAELRVGPEGCVYVLVDGVSRLAIWPAGSTLSDPVRLPDGQELLDGEAIQGTGTVMPPEALPGGLNGYWAHVTGFCEGDVDEVVVFDEVSARR